MALKRHRSHSQNIFTQKILRMIYLSYYIFVLTKTLFCFVTFNYKYFCHLFLLIYIVYRRWRCVRFLECIYTQYKTRYTYVPYRHYHAIINRFFLNAFVRAYYYQFGLFTL